MSRSLWPLVALLSLRCAAPDDPADPTPADTDAVESDPPDTDAADDEPAPPAPEAPRVGAMVPASGSDGALPATEIRLTFTEDMDADSVEGAVRSDALGGGWSARWEGPRTLVLTPDAPLPVRPADEVVRGATVDVQVGVEARSAAGLALVAPFYGDFEVARSTVVELSPEPGMCGRVGADGVAYAGTLQVGDASDNIAYRGFLSFDGSLLPPVVAVRQAALTLPYSGVIGTPWSGLGDLSLDGMRYATFTGDLFEQAPSHPGVVGYVGSQDGGIYGVDVTAAAAVSLLDRTTYGNRVQLRLAFDAETDFDGGTDWVMFQCGGDDPPALDLDLLIP